jgi:hypothetical protein
VPLAAHPRYGKESDDFARAIQVQHQAVLRSAKVTSVAEFAELQTVAPTPGRAATTSASKTPELQ